MMNFFTSDERYSLAQIVIRIETAVPRPGIPKRGTEPIYTRPTAASSMPLKSFGACLELILMAVLRPRPVSKFHGVEATILVASERSIPAAFEK
jgi:hypothetical protein